MSNIFRLKWSIFSYEASQLNHSDGRGTHAHLSRLNRSSGGGIGLCDDESVLSDSRSGKEIIEMPQ